MQLANERSGASTLIGEEDETRRANLEPLETPQIRFREPAKQRVTIVQPGKD